ncbi:MAG: hypothetical protein AAGC68_03675 [Verrucomicrobiota bacterium]
MNRPPSHRYLALLSGVTCILSTPVALHADILTGVGRQDEPSMEQDGPPPVFVFDIDSDSGATSRVQNLTSRGPAFDLGSLTRNAAGDLYGIYRNDTVVLIDEETGTTTEICTLTDSEGGSYNCPAISFGSFQGIPETLYAIARSTNKLPFNGDDDSDRYFKLLTVDLETGVVTDTGALIGGADLLGENPAHGLQFDPSLDALVHFWNEGESLDVDIDISAATKSDRGFDMGGTPTSAKVELIQPHNDQIYPVGFNPGYTMTMAMDSVKEPRTDDVMMEPAVPGGFSAVAGNGSGTFYVLDFVESDDDQDCNLRGVINRNGLQDQFCQLAGPVPAVYRLMITGNSMTGYFFTSEVDFTLEFPFFGNVPVDAQISFQSNLHQGQIGVPAFFLFENFRSLELSEDGNELLVDLGGILLPFALSGIDQGFQVGPGLITNIGGFTPEILSLATDPVTGAIFALAYAGGRGFRSRRNVESGVTQMGTNQIGMTPTPNTGLYILNQDSGPNTELVNFDVTFNDPNLLPFDKEANNKTSRNNDYVQDGGPPLSELVAIAFDDIGTLFGLTMFGSIVTIDVVTGDLVEFASLMIPDSVDGRSAQLEFNPVDRKLYILYLDRDGYRLGFGCVNTDGLFDDRIFTEIPLDIYPNERIPAIKDPRTDDSDDSPRPSAEVQNLVHVGGGNFIFSAYDSKNALNGDEPSMNFWQLTSQGAVSLLQGTTSFDITGLTLPGSPSRPDVLIGPSQGRLTGQGIYNGSGAGQSFRIRKTVKRLRGSYSARVENDGLRTGTFQISASTGKRTDRFRFIQNGANVTGLMRVGLLLELNPGESSSFAASFSRRKGKNWRQRLRFSALGGSGIDTGTVFLQLKRPASGSESVRPTTL